MKIGFFGGCFNPPTNAHINLAKKVLKECKLDKIIFVPMGDSYKKKELAKAKDRYKMLKIACKDIRQFEVSDIEIKENRQMNTIDAFRLIDKKYSKEEKYFILGADNLIKIKEWKESEELISKYRYIVLKRAGIDLKGYTDKHNKVKNSILNIIENEEYKDSSATKFRKELKSDKCCIKDMVSKDVYNYIIENDIY